MTVYYPAFKNHREAVIYFSKQIKLCEARILVAVANGLCTLHIKIWISDGQ